MNSKGLLQKIFGKIRNKYVIASIIFVVWIGFFDEHNLVSHYRYKTKLKRYQNQMVYYKEKIKSDKQKLHELQTNKENLEKFAREQYYMAKKDEEVFVIAETD